MKQHQHKESLIGVCAILFATLMWGMTFAFIKDAVATLSPSSFLFWRFGIASVLLFGIFYLKISIGRQTLTYGVLLGLLLAGTVGFQTIGLRYTSASTASFITGLSVILVAIFELIIKKEWPSFYLIAATLLAVVGVGLITLTDQVTINQGDLWVLACAFCFAGYIILAGKAAHIHQPLTLTFLQSLVICAIALITGFLTLGKITVPQHSNVWIAILFCSIFASIIAFILQLKFQKYVSSTRAAIIFSLEPVFATITAAIYLHERLTVEFFIGAAMIFCAILLSEKQSERKVIPQE